MLVIAGTGHRPDKLGGYSQQVSDRLIQLAESSIQKYQPTKIISGMALGWDTALAKAALNLSIPLIAAVPFEGQESKWGKSDRNQYRRIIAQASEVVYVSELGYETWKMEARNRWMVDHCDLLLALHNGSEGGTCNCVRYAESKGVRTVNLWNSWIKYSGIEL